MKIIDDPQELQRIMVVRNRIAAENIVNFVDGEDDIVAHAFSAETSGGFIGVRNDYDIHEDHAVIVEPAPKDFDLLGREFIGQGFLLFSEDERLAVLFTAVDYKLIAGPLSFLHRQSLRTGSHFPEYPCDCRGLRHQASRSGAILRPSRRRGKWPGHRCRRAVF